MLVVPCTSYLKGDILFSAFGPTGSDYLHKGVERAL